LCFIQIGRAVLDGGRAFATLLVGIGQYSLITAGGLGFLAVLVTASDALAVGLLKGGLNIDNWQGITAQNSVLTNAVHSVGGVGVGVLAIFVLFPAVLGLVVETLVRNASILVLAATIPLLAAGLVQESTTRWFWIGLRWMIALLLMSPALALVMVLGLRTAAGAAGAGGGGASQGAGTAAVQVLIGLVVLLISLTCPWALFKLFAFVDPSSVSGGRVRGFFGSGASGGGGSTPATGGSDSDGSDDATSNRFTNALSAGSGMAQDVASSSASAAGGMLDTMGAGHQGSVRDESSKSDKSKGRDQDQDSDQSSDGGDDSTPDAQPQGPAPADASAPPTQPPGDGGSPGGPSPAGAPGGGAPGGGGAGGGGAAGGAGEAAAATEGVEAAAVVVAL
jgi:hypothetical protein